MSAAEQQIHTLLLPMNGFNLVLPQAAVAEVVSRPRVTAQEGSDDWLLGIFDWRTEQVPLISFEALTGRQRAVPPENARAIVLNAFGGFDGLSFYAMELHGIPHPLVLENRMIETVEDGSRDQHDPVAHNIVVAGQPGIVPAMYRIEQQIVSRLEIAPQ